MNKVQALWPMDMHRASGRPGVALVISGPGVTNALTAIGQAYADSIPVLLLSADAESHSLGKGWGCLHEVPRLTDTTAAVDCTFRQQPCRRQMYRN